MKRNDRRTGRKARITALLAASGLGLLAVSGTTGCAYHGHGGYYGGYYGGRCGPDPVGAVVVGTAAIFYAIGSACH